MSKRVAQRKTKKSAEYGKGYFTGSFHGAVGSFSKKDLERSINWFTGWINFLNRYIPIKNGHRKLALEVGCSIGGAANVMTLLGYKVDATDISSYAISHAKKLSPHVNFFVQDIEKPIKSGKTYDVIWGFEVIEHIKNPSRALKNLYDVLKPDGILICSTPYPYQYAYEEPTHISVNYPDEWRQVFEKTGFKKVKIIRGAFIPFLYKYHARFSIGLPLTIGSRRINSPIFIIARKPRTNKK